LRPALEDLAQRVPGYLEHVLQDSAEGSRQGWTGDWAVEAVATARAPHEIGLHGATHIPWTWPGLTEDVARRELGLLFDARAPILSRTTTYIFPRNADAHPHVLDEFGVAGLRRAFHHGKGVAVEVGRVAADLVGRLTPRGYRVDFWDTFIAGRSAAMSRVEEILANGLPGDLMQLDMAIEATSPIVRHVQEFMARNGIAPFSGSMLVGEIEPALTVVVAEPDGTIVATAHAYRPHNAHSPYHTTAWGGLIAVAESQRGRKLGTYVNAMMIRAAFEQLAVDRIYELASATNIPSRRMIEACGLSMEPNLKAATAGPQGEKFTR